MNSRGRGSNTIKEIGGWITDFYLSPKIIGDLTFGEPFGGLANVAYHPWISMLFQALKIIHYTAEARRWKLLSSFLMLLTPASARRKAEEHYNITAQKVKQRLEMHTDRSDFMDAMTRHQGEKVSHILPAPVTRLEVSNLTFHFFFCRTA